MTELSYEDIISLEFSKKKKKTKEKTKEKINETFNETFNETISVNDIIQIDTVPLPIYSYEFLLDRVSQLIAQNMIDLNGANNVKKYKISSPILVKVGSKRTVWTNFPDFCNQTTRSSDHIFQYIMTELGSDCSIDTLGRFVIKGKYAPAYIESLMHKYMQEYVICSSCHKYNTTLTRDNISRIYFIRCNDCTSVHSATNIKQGYHAQTRADRIANRK